MSITVEFHDAGVADQASVGFGYTAEDAEAAFIAPAPGQFAAFVLPDSSATATVQLSVSAAAAGDSGSVRVFYSCAPRKAIQARLAQLEAAQAESSLDGLVALVALLTQAGHPAAFSEWTAGAAAPGVTLSDFFEAPVACIVILCTSAVSQAAVAHVLAA